MSKSENGEFDYVVVGAGTAGCVVAARLTEDPDVRVLLLESGPADKHPLIPVPTAWLGLFGTEVDYAYRTTPQPGLGGAEMSWPRGHTVGGSSSINGMVYLRGHRDDYDSWERQFGATGWSYREVLPYLRKAETVPGADPTWRGLDGPMRPARAGDPHPLSEVFLAAAAAAGYPISADLNGAQAEGAGWNDLAIHDGRRQSIADGYLKPVLSRPNLTVATGSRATRLLVAAGQCVGVSYSQDGQIKQARAEAEVILSAGAIDSPRLLLLSGIGPADELRSAGVQVLHDLPGVGRNLHDHPLTSVVYSTIRESPAGSNSSGEVSLSWRSDSALTGHAAAVLPRAVPPTNAAVPTRQLHLLPHDRAGQSRQHPVARRGPHFIAADRPEGPDRTARPHPARRRDRGRAGDRPAEPVRPVARRRGPARPGRHQPRRARRLCAPRHRPLLPPSRHLRHGHRTGRGRRHPTARAGPTGPTRGGRIDHAEDRQREHQRGRHHDRRTRRGPPRQQTQPPH